MAKKSDGLLPTRPGGLSQYQRFETETIHRKDLKEAPYNPRIIDDGNKKRLAAALRKHGLVEPLVWNRRTGTLVSGHQRLSILDALEGSDDYALTVAVVDVDDREEKVLNVQLNNSSTQGEWDPESLAVFNTEFDIGFEEMGFTEFDVDTMFGGDERFSELFEDDADVRAAKDTLRDIKRDRAEATKKLKEEQAADIYFMVVCDSQAEKTEMFKAMGVPITEQVVSSGAVKRMASKG